MEKKIGNKEDFYSRKMKMNKEKTSKKKGKKEKIMYVHSTVQGKEIGGRKNKQAKIHMKETRSNNTHTKVRKM